MLKSAKTRTLATNNLLPIELPEGFPFEELGKLVKVEGRGPEISRPPLYLHKWWARRFGSIFRSILLGLLLKKNDNVWEAHYHGHDFTDVTILDPFMGGGTTLFEAVRLGANVVGCDINPVAWWTTRTSLTQPSSWEKLQKTFDDINQEASILFGKYYETICPVCLQDGATTRHVRWAHTLSCEQCGEQTTLFKSYFLGKHKDGIWVICPECKFVFWSNQSRKQKTCCPDCKVLFQSKEGNVNRGKFTCTTCNHENDIRKAMVQRDNPIDQAKMIAILYECPEHGWGLKKPTGKDLENYQEAGKTFLNEESVIAIPKQRISTENRTDPRPVNFGYRYWHQMFTPRQLLVLGWLAAQVREMSSTDVKDTFATIVSQLVNYSNVFCVPRPNRPAAISWIFRMHAFVPPTDFIENNPLGGKHASGTFQSLFWRSVRTSYEYRQQPVERKLDDENPNQSRAVIIEKEDVKVKIVESWEELEQTSQKAALLLCQPSYDLPLPNQSISHVVTDPPFYDNVAYGELSQFNYVWLREMLGNEIPEFSTTEIKLNDELIVSKKIGKDDYFYAEGMAKVFTECHRVLADEGTLTFSFHHKSKKAWETLLYALLKAEFRVSTIHPVRSESDRSLHIMNGDTIEHDLIIVCRKATEPHFILWDTLIDQILFNSKELVSRLDASHQNSNANVSVLVFGQCLKSFSEYYPEIYKPGGEVSIAEALYAAEQIAKVISESPDNAEIWQPRLLERMIKYENSAS